MQFISKEKTGKLIYLGITKDSEILFLVIVPDSKSRNIPEVVLVRRWAVGILGIWKEGVGWVKGGAIGVSLQAT